MKKKNEEMMFLGVDGFNEIESIVPEKKQKKTAKTAKTEKSASATRKVDFKEIADKLKLQLRASKKKSFPAHSAGGKRERTVYRKRAVLAVGASVTAVMLSIVTVAGALDGGSTPADNKEPETTSVSSLPATLDEPVIFDAIVSKTADEGEASALYIDGNLAGAADDGAALEAALAQVLADAKAGYDETTTTEFANNVEIKPYSGSDVMSVDELMAKVEGQLSIKMETDWTYEATVDFETEITYDDSQPSDYEVVTREGVNGVTEVTIRLTYTDGVQTDAAVTGEKVITEVVNEQKTVGSANGTPEAESDNSDSSEGTSSSASGSGSSTGSFIWPAPHTHSITSYMEWRWGRMHNGIDIAGGGDYGQPIIASDGGTVVFSGNDGGGYGNYVMIDHGNGYMTVYGHASELACSTGEYVSQGQTIAYIGSTGNSTGPHLHFEIRLNGEYMDPTNYVS